MAPSNKAAPAAKKPDRSDPHSAAAAGNQEHVVDPAQIPLPPSIAETEKKKESTLNENDPAITSLYLKYADETDSGLMNQYDADMDILLLFVSAFQLALVQEDRFSSPYSGDTLFCDRYIVRHAVFQRCAGRLC